MFGSLRANIQVWLVEWGIGCGPWGVTGVNEARGILYTICAVWSQWKWSGLTVPTEQKLVDSDLLELGA